MRMSKRQASLWVMGALGISAVVALASQPQGGRGRHGFRGRQGGPMAMLRELDLTETQRGEVRQLFEQARETGAQKRLMDAKRALEEAVETSEPDVGAIQELAYQVGMAEGEVAIERVQMRARLREILTEEQRQKHDELEAERKREREERRQRLEERREQRQPQRQPQPEE